jgi:uncharacterized membrane protein
MTYRVLIVLHVLGAVAFFSNAVAAYFWQARASASEDPRVIAHTFRTLMVSDLWITPIAVVALVATGLGAAAESGLSLLGTGWILWSIVAFSASGAAFAAVLPLQRRLARWTAAGVVSGDFDWTRYRRESRRWAALAHLSLGLAAVALILMVLRPPLPSL